MDDLRELYQEVILEHGKSPRNFRVPDPYSNHAHGHNPLCGDQIDVFLQVDGEGKVADLGFQGRGCAISVASASLMTEMLRGKPEAEAKALFEAFHQMCAGDEDGAAAAEVDEDALDNLMVLAGVRQFPMRVKCATLAWHTMKAALEGEAAVNTEEEEG